MPWTSAWKLLGYGPPTKKATSRRSGCCLTTWISWCTFFLRTPASTMIWSGVTEALVEYAAPRAGMQVLDLASGTGEPGISLAQRVLPGGSVTAVDLSADSLEVAAQRARSKELPNFSIHQADAQQLPFPDR